MNNKKILLADDDDSVRQTGALILKSWGMDVIVSENGRDVIDIVRDETLDLIILDVVMPVIDGFVVCKILKQDPKTQNIPIILLTGLDKTGYVNKGYECGADCYMIKPVDWDEIKLKISKLLKN